MQAYFLLYTATEVVIIVGLDGTGECSTFIRSMPRDNAACKGLFRSLKTEMYHGRESLGITPEKFMQL